MNGDSGDPVIYSRQKRSKGAKVFKEPSAKEEVDDLLSSLESNLGGCQLEVLTIERIQKGEWQSSFERKKDVLRQRSEESGHWKYDELDTRKRQMRNKLLGADKVLDKRVYVGLDSDQIVEGIVKTGFASTKCRNNWFGFGHYVTTHAWYAARYGLDGCYDNNGGILDPHSEIAVGKQGRLLVCRAVMSNVYPITRSCAEDHAIKDFDTAAQKGKLWSEWYNEVSSKPRAMNPGYDTHFVRVKKKDAGDYSNFLACPDDDVLKLEDEIADELVLLAEEQLLPEYFVHFCVRKLAVGRVFESESSSGSDQVYLKVDSSPAGIPRNLSDHSLPSTQKGADSPPNVDVLLVFTEKKEWSYMLGKRQELDENGLVAHFSDKISTFREVHKAAKVKNPSIVYIEGSSNRFDWRRGSPGAELIEEFVKNLGNTAIPGREWIHWRGCIVNLGTTKPDIAESLCEKHPGKLSLLSWVSQPNEEDIDNLWQRFFDDLDPTGLIEDKQNAFKEACLEALQHIPDKLHMAPDQQSVPALDDPKAFAASVSDALKGKQPSTQQPKAAALELEVSEAEKAKFLEQESEAAGGETVPMATKSSVPLNVSVPKASLAEAEAAKKYLRRIKAAFKGPPELVEEMAGLLKSPLQISMVGTKDVSIEAHINTEPPVPNYEVEISTVEEIYEFEQNIKKVTGGKCILTGTGSFYVKMGIEAFEWLRRRVHGNDTPLHVKLPKAWACGVGEARVSKVLPGRMCWLKAIMQAQDVHRLCNHLSVQLEKMKTEDAALGENLSTQQGRWSSSTVSSLSRSIVLPGWSRNMEAIDDMSNYHLGNLRLGNFVRVFSHSIRQWCDGKIVRLLDESCIYVEYQVGYQDWHGKKVHVDSDDLILPTSAVPALSGTSQQEPFGEEVFEVRIATFADEVLLEVSGVELLGEFKERVANKLGWMSEQMKLFHDGIHLDKESQRLFDCGLSPNDNELQAVQASAIDSDATKPRAFNNKLDEKMIVEIASSRQPFVLQTYDFAGQMEYHVMFHRFFMSNNGISAIVFSLQALEEDPKTTERHISFWISSVLEHAPASRVVIIATHKDNYPTQTTLTGVSQKATILLEDMMKQFDIAPLLVRNDKEDKLFFPVDNSRSMEDHGIDILRTSIENECRKLLTPPKGSLSRPLPLRWLKLQDWLEQRAGKQDGWYIKKDELYARAKGRQFSFETTEECDLFLDYMVSAGAACYFQSAEDCIVVNPNEMVCALADMMAFRDEKLPKHIFKTQVQTRDDWLKLKEKGLLTSSIAKLILSHKTEQNQNLVLKVLKESGVIVSHGTDEWYVPSVMPFIQHCFEKSMEPPPCEGTDIVVLTDTKYPSAAPTLLVQLLCRAVTDPFNGELELYSDHARLRFAEALDCQWKVELLRTKKSSIRWSLRSGKQVHDTPMMHKALEVLQKLIHEFDEHVVSTGPPCPAKRCTGLHMHSIDFSQIYECIDYSQIYGCEDQSYEGPCGECVDCRSMPDWVQKRVQHHCLPTQQTSSAEDQQSSGQTIDKAVLSFKPTPPKPSGQKFLKPTHSAPLKASPKPGPIHAPFTASVEPHNAPLNASMEPSSSTSHEASMANIVEKLLQTEEKKDVFDRAIKAGESNISTLKMILLGEGRSGKTSTWKALVGRDFDPNEDSTHGLNAERVATRHLKDWEVKKRDEVAGVYEMGIHHSAAEVLLSQANRDLKAEIWEPTLPLSWGGSARPTKSSEEEQSDQKAERLTQEWLMLWKSNNWAEGWKKEKELRQHLQEKEEEKRIADKRIADDGISYTKEGFQDFYGDAWSIKWLAAEVAKDYHLVSCGDSIFVMDAGAGAKNSVAKAPALTVKEGHDCFATHDALTVCPANIRLCVRICAELKFGGFAVSSGTAYFRKHTQSECLANLTPTKDVTFYLCGASESASYCLDRESEKAAPFTLYEGYDCFSTLNALRISPVDINLCKRVCAEKKFGGFAVYRGKAYFRKQTHLECLANLTPTEGVTFYVCGV